MVRTIILSQISKNYPSQSILQPYQRQRRPVIISAPKEDVITAIVEATQRNRHTVRCWMYGYTQPNSMVEKKIVAEILQSDVATLFPERKEE